MSSVENEPYDRTEYDGVLDMHWSFDTWDEAKIFSNKLKKFDKNPNVIFMKASNTKSPDASIIYKDKRYNKPTSKH